jgi:hypothetical protein
MIYPQNNQSELAAYLLTIMLVLAIIGRYGKQVIQWGMMKLYEILIQKKMMNL